MSHKKEVYHPSYIKIVKLRTLRWAGHDMYFTRNLTLSRLRRNLDDYMDIVFKRIGLSY